jgi:hypothetical protein
MEAETHATRSWRHPEFRAWFAAFLPKRRQTAPCDALRARTVSDRTDGKIAHLDGLNLSRAWCWRGIAGALAENDPARAVALEAADVASAKRARACRGRLYGRTLAREFRVAGAGGLARDREAQRRQTFNAAFDCVTWIERAHAEGEPVKIKSPGFSSHQRESAATISGTLQIMSWVLAS